MYIYIYIYEFLPFCTGKITLGHLVYLNISYIYIYIINYIIQSANIEMTCVSLFQTYFNFPYITSPCVFGIVIWVHIHHEIDPEAYPGRADALMAEASINLWRVTSSWEISWDGHVTCLSHDVWVLPLPKFTISLKIHQSWKRFLTDQRIAALKPHDEWCWSFTTATRDSTKLSSLSV